MVKSDFQRVASRIEGYDQAIVDWQRCLTAIKAIAPESGGVGEKEKADYLRTILESFNPGEIFSIDAPDERVPAGYRPNLVAKFYGRMKDRTLWIISHLDVVPPGDLNLWKSDPFTIKVEGDKIYGRGVEDNQQSIVTVLALLKALIEEKVEPGYTIGFIAVSDEETGSAKGLKYVVEKRRGLFGENDLILVPD
ncbi:MAG: M20/M25/M40 family metallo-hydrolase [Candidatus Bathyarchaeia archaeon]